MRINFILPGYFDMPIGGYKIVYSYANGLIRKGYDIHITYVDCFDGRRFPKPLWKALRILKHKITLHKKRVSWFPLDSKVHLHLLTHKVDAGEVPDSDIVVATAASTAHIVNSLPSTKGKKFYFVQHDESTFSIDHEVRKTWHYPMKKIVVASWLKSLIESETGHQCDFVPNFIEDKVFDIDTKLENRSKSLSMLIHKDKIKGTEYGLQALLNVQHIYPDVAVKLFGTGIFEGYKDLRYEYVRNANSSTLRQIYNFSSIFVLPSVLEGWGLTATEAMRCGSALVSTQNGGVNDFAVNGYSALIVSPKNSDMLTNAIMELLDDPTRRIRVATNGYNQVSQLTFEKSLNLFEKSLLRN